MPPRLISTKHTSKVSFSSIARNSHPVGLAISASGSHCSTRYLSSLLAGRSSSTTAILIPQALPCSIKNSAVPNSRLLSSALPEDRQPIVFPKVRFSCAVRRPSARPSLLHLSRSGVRDFPYKEISLAARSSFRFLVCSTFSRRMRSGRSGSPFPVRCRSHRSSWIVPPVSRLR